MIDGDDDNNDLNPKELNLLAFQSGAFYDN